MFIVSNFQRLLPDVSFPTARQRLVFQPVEVLLIIFHESRLQRAKPVLWLPTERHDAQGVTRQLGLRVVRDRLAAVEEERDFIPAKYPAQRVVIAIQRS